MSKTEFFIKRAKEIHGNNYDYSKVEYKKAREKVCIICSKHGDFWQTADNHLRGHGCPRCQKKEKVENHQTHTKYTTESFIQKAKEIHDDKYDYSLTNYISSSIKVKIKCKKCGNVFEQLPTEHLSGKGCFKCRKPKPLKKEEDIITEANKVHNNFYIYPKGCYIKYHVPMKIICPIHGAFYQTPAHHLQGSNCPYCRQSSNEEKVNNILQEMKLSFKSEYIFSDLKPLRFDFYSEELKVAIEFNGEQHYRWVKFFDATYHDFLVQKHHDWLKRKYCQKNNIRLIVIPYWEKNINNFLKRELSNYVQKIHN